MAVAGDGGVAGGRGRCRGYSGWIEEERGVGGFGDEGAFEVSGGVGEVSRNRV